MKISEWNIDTIEDRNFNSLWKNIPIDKDKPDDSVIVDQIEYTNWEILDINNKYSKKNVDFNEELYWNSYDIIENTWCVENCVLFNEEIKKEIWSLLNKNSNEIYDDLNKLFYKISWWEFNINFYESIEYNSYKITEFFDKFFDWKKYDFNFLINSYELINKFFIMNHWNTIEWNDIYNLSNSVIWKLEDFLNNYNEDLWYSDDNLLSLENMLWRFYISHSHLKKIDFSSSKNAIEWFNFILEKQIKWIDIIKKTNFWWNPEFLNSAINIFIINYSYIYWQFLNYLKENWLWVENISNDYFKFNKKNFSVEERKEEIFNHFLDILKEVSYNEILWNINFKEVDDVLLYFLNHSDNKWYSSVIILEIIHHILSIFPEKEKTLDTILQFWEKLFLDDNNPGHVLNSMKLRTLNLILNRIFDDNISDENILDFLKKTEENIDLKWSDMISEYARIWLPISGIYSNFYKKYENEISSINNEINLALNYKEKEAKIFEKKWLIEKVENLKSKSIEYLSNYSEIYLEYNNWISKDDSIRKRDIIIKNLFSNDFSLDFWNKNFLNKLYNKDKKILFLEKKSNLINWIKDIIYGILKNNYNFDEINIYLNDVSKIFFKNICDIKIILAEDFVKNDRYSAEIINLWNWYYLFFNVNKKFSALFEVFFNERIPLIYEIRNILSEFIKKYREHFFNQITDIKNNNFYDRNIDDMVKKEEPWALIVLDLDYYNPGVQSNKKAIDIISEKIKENADFYKKLKKQWLCWHDFELYHVDNLRFNLLFKWDNIDLDYLIKEIEWILKDSSYLLDTKVSWIAWKINRQSEWQSIEWNLFDNNILDPEVYIEINDAMNNRPEDILFYTQPIVDKNGLTVKYEALTRVRKKNGWIIDPDDFFWMLKKDPNFNYKFTKLLLKRSFEIVNKYWINLSLNLSTQDISYKWDELKKYFKELIGKYWTNIIEKITIELLEDNFWSYFIDDLLDLKKMWFKIAIDDFWSGSSNFQRYLDLINLECVDILKIDWSLIKWLVEYSDMDWIKYESILSIKKKKWISWDYNMIEWADYKVKVNEKNKNLIKVILSLAKEDWLDVICEYIEDKHIVEVLNDIWDNYMQWYHFSKPEFYMDILEKDL